MNAAATSARPTSIASPTGDVRKSSRLFELGRRSTKKRTDESVVEFPRFIHVSELDVELLGAGAPAGTVTFTEYVAFDC